MKTITIKEEGEFKIERLTESFLNYIDVSDKTIETYKIALKQFAKYMEDNYIKTPTREDIIGYRESLKEILKPTTVNSYMIAVRNFFKYLEYENIYKNITENVKGVKLEQKHLKLGLSLEEVKSVLEQCKNDKEVLMVKMFTNLGLRENELVNIKLEDFYSDTGVIMLKILGKARNGIKQDAVKIDDKLYNSIKEYVVKNDIKDYLFTSECHRNLGGQMSTSAVRHLIKDLFRRANLNDIELKSCHSLRHTTAQILLENDVPIQEVSEYLRHKSLNTTMIYLKELNQRESKCSNILADNLF